MHIGSMEQRLVRCVHKVDHLKLPLIKILIMIVANKGDRSMACSMAGCQYGFDDYFQCPVTVSCPEKAMADLCFGSTENCVADNGEKSDQLKP